MGRRLLSLAVAALVTTVACGDDDDGGAFGGVQGNGNQETGATDTSGGDLGLEDPTNPPDPTDAATSAGAGYSEETRADVIEACDVAIEVGLVGDASCDCVYENISQTVPFEEYLEALEGPPTPDWWYAAFDACGG